MNEIIVDNFAGGGGASTGIELATGRPVDIAINHDPDAILMHKTNHPHTKHYCESVWDVDPKQVCAGRPVGLMWLSPDCKHFSRAKGGKPVDKNVRGLAWIAVRWTATVHPRVIILKNVPEFITWGPLTKDSYPDKTKQGRTFNCFINALKRYGYAIDWRELKACDYGAPTIRKRFFLIARCDGAPIVWPEASHGEGKQPFKTAADCIDWSIPCASIFGRKTPLRPNTMRRIARGLEKFTLKSDRPFIIQYKYDNSPQDISHPLSTVTTVNGHYIVDPKLHSFMVPIGYGERKGQSPRCNSINEPVSTVVASTVKQGFVAPSIQKYYGGITGSPVDDPLGTVTAIDHNALLASSLIQYHSETAHSEVRGQALQDPLMTVDASNRYGLMGAHIVKYYSGDNYSAANDPLGTVTTHDRCGLVETHICKYDKSADLGNWPKIRAMLNEYCGYELADDEILLLSIGGSDYYIRDIGMRMLAPRELYNAQGFPPDYIIDHDYTGKEYSRVKQVARCGNAVPPPFAEALVRANLPEMCGKKYTTMHELGEVM